jgi:small conductance mechanosensitive channel
MTRDYSYYLIDTKVSYRYDPDDIAAALRETDEELRVDPKFKHDILMPIEVMGLETFADTSFIVRARVRTRPMRQWDIGREFNRRLKRNLQDRGIMLDVPGAAPFAPPQQIEGPKKRAGGRPN